MIQSDHSNLASVSENSNLTILKATKVLKGAGLDDIPRRFPIDGAKFLTKYYYSEEYVCTSKSIYHELQEIILAFCRNV